MKFVDEFRDASVVADIVQRIHARQTQPWNIMEVCGGQTHSIVKYGLDTLLPATLQLIHGPGCPVCVTPAAVLDQAFNLALAPGVTLCSFGDMLRVPGTQQSLLQAREQGGDVRTVYSPLDAVQLAQQQPEQQVVFLAIGFETTAPLNAMAVLRAKALGLTNFSLLASQVTVPPAIELVMQQPDNQIDGFLAAGHVCAIMGLEQYQPLAEKYQVPIVATGFEPVDILLGIERCVAMLESGCYSVDNAYTRAVSSPGNLAAQQALKQVFELADQSWRGLGEIKHSGLVLREAFQDFDAQRRFSQYLPELIATKTECRSGDILTGVLKPEQCPAFGKACTPEHPQGAPMVSEEGACHAYYRYRSQGGE